MEIVADSVVGMILHQIVFDEFCYRFLSGEVSIIFRHKIRLFSRDKPPLEERLLTDIYLYALFYAH